MTLHISGLDWARALVGIPFPTGDEDAVRRCGQAWRMAAVRLRAVRTDAAEIRAEAERAVSGATGEAFAHYWQPLTDGSSGQIADACDALAAACEHAAAEIERAKILFLTALAALAGFAVAIVGAGLATGLVLSYAIATAQLRIYGVLGALLLTIVLGPAINTVVDITRNVERALKLLGIDWDILIAGTKPPPPRTDDSFDSPYGRAPVMDADPPPVWGAPSLPRRGPDVTDPVLAGDTPLETVPAHGPVLGQATPAPPVVAPPPPLVPAPPPPVPAPPTPVPTTPAPVVPRAPAPGPVGPRSAPVSVPAPPQPSPTPAPPARLPSPTLVTPVVLPPPTAAAPVSVVSPVPPTAPPFGVAPAVTAPASSVTPVAVILAAVGHPSAAPNPARPGPTTEDDALARARRCLFATEAGYGFYPAGDENRELASAVRPVPGHVTIDVFGDAEGFTIDSGRLTPSQFATVLGELIDSGELNLREPAIRLVAAQTGDGPASPAATLARELGIEVLAPDCLLWTDLGGEEVHASVHLVEGVLVPADPPDGHWHRFSADGPMPVG